MDPHHRNEISRTPVAWQQRDVNKGYARSNHSRYSNHNDSKSVDMHDRSRLSSQEEAHWNYHKDKESVSSRSNMRHNDAARSQTMPISSQESAEDETTETDSQTMPSAYPNGYPQFGVPVEFPSHPPSMIAPGMPQQQLFLAPNGSIRSVHSVPMLTATAAAAPAPTWDGEPCPVHHPHHHPTALPLAALYGMGPPAHGHPGHAYSMGPPSIPPSVISGAPTVRRARSIAELSNAGYGLQLMQHPHQHPSTPRARRPPPHDHGSMRHFAPMMPINNRMVLSENGTPSALPTREHNHDMSRAGTLQHGVMPGRGHSEMNEKDNAYICCSGHLVVLWIILGIVTFGILLAMLLKFTIT